MGSPTLLSTSYDKVLAYDMQVLFGKNMKSTDVINELLPARTIVSEDTISNNADGLSSMDDWLKGLISNG